MKFTVFSDHMKIRGEITLSSLLRTFRSGLELLSTIRVISASGANVSVLGALSFAGLVFFLRDGRMGNFNSFLWSSESTSLDKLCVPGLSNLGNNCFLNAILQALASCTTFKHFLEENNEELLPSSVEDVSPLSFALASLLADLCTLQDRRRVLSPGKVMSLMDFYIPQFKLTNQQDAAEAFLHLLSCLREEFSESYVPKYGTLADVAACSDRFISRKGDDVSEPRRWRRQFLGPFDGIISSFLTCRSCSSEIMMDFEFFHTLPLSPLSNNSTLDGWTLEDCIGSFMSAERVENYYCSHCWHVAAIKYLSTLDGHGKEIEKLSGCNEQDSCGCRNLSILQALPWSNRFSHTFKQLSIAHCPKILCLHIQRASVNIFGEPAKIEGHIIFPQVLDLKNFLKKGWDSENWIEKTEGRLVKQHHQLTFSHPNLNGVVGDGRKLSLVKLAEETTAYTSVDRYMQAFQKFGSPSSQTSYSAYSTNTQSEEKVTSDGYVYRLVSVVEHFGRAGGGHYIVYRGVRTEVDGGDGDARNLNVSHLQWFSISDADVRSASVKDVLAA